MTSLLQLKKLKPLAHGGGKNVSVRGGGLGRKGLEMLTGEIFPGGHASQLQGVSDILFAICTESTTPNAQLISFTLSSRPRLAPAPRRSPAGGSGHQQQPAEPWVSCQTGREQLRFSFSAQSQNTKEFINALQWVSTEFTRS